MKHATHSSLFGFSEALHCLDSGNNDCQGTEYRVRSSESGVVDERLSD